MHSIIKINFFYKRQKYYYQHTEHPFLINKHPHYNMKHINYNKNNILKWIQNSFLSTYPLLKQRTPN